MKLFGNSLKELKKNATQDIEDNNFSEEDYPMLVAECITTAMEVSVFTNQIMEEADTEIITYMESNNLTEDSEELNKFYAEAAFGSDDKKGILGKIWDFIKGLYKKIASMVSGLLNKFKNNAKEIRKVMADFEVLMSEIKGKNLPDSTSYETKIVDYEGGFKFIQKILDYSSYEETNIGQSGNSLSNLIEKGDKVKNDLMNGNTNKQHIKSLQDVVNEFQTTIGSENNTSAQRKIMASVINKCATDSELKNFGAIDFNGSDDPQEKLNDAIFDEDTKKYYGNEVKTELLDGTHKVLTKFDIDKVTTALSKGKEKFQDKADKINQQSKALSKEAEKVKEKEKESTEFKTQASNVTALYSQYSTIIATFTAVTTKGLNFGNQLTIKLFRQLGRVIKDVQSLYDNNATKPNTDKNDKDND